MWKGQGRAERAGPEGLTGGGLPGAQKEISSHDAHVRPQHDARSQRSPTASTCQGRGGLHAVLGGWSGSCLHHSPTAQQGTTQSASQPLPGPPVQGTLTPGTRSTEREGRAPLAFLRTASGAPQVQASTVRAWGRQRGVPSLRMAMMSTMKGERSYCQMRAMSMEAQLHSKAHRGSQHAQRSGSHLSRRSSSSLVPTVCWQDRQQGRL